MAKMTREEFDLLQGVIENPDDVASRLVYADWLEEHGEQKRADFIRRHCESIPFTNGMGLADKAVARRWKRFVPKEVRDYFSYEVNYNGGFLSASSIKVPNHCEELKTVVELLFQYAPIRTLSLLPQAETGNVYFGAAIPMATDFVRVLCELPNLQRLSHLHLHCPFESMEETVNLIVQCPYLEQIRTLNFHLRYQSTSGNPYDWSGYEWGQMETQVVDDNLKKQLQKRFGNRVVWHTQGTGF